MRYCVACGRPIFQSEYDSLHGHCEACCFQADEAEIEAEGVALAEADALIERLESILETDGPRHIRPEELLRGQA